MSESIRRKSSSRQVLQNLIRVTAQRSQEDAEEVERERRRRSREKERGEGSSSWPEPPRQNEVVHNTELDADLKPSCCLVLEEDEGFSDWTHRLEHRNEQEVQDDCRATVQRPSTPQWKLEPEEEKQQEDEEQQEQEECEPERSIRSQEASPRPAEKLTSNRKEVRASYSSTVFLPQDARLQHATGQPADRTSYLVAGTMRPRGAAPRVDGRVEQEDRKDKEELQVALQTDWRSTETRQSSRDEEEEEEDKLSFTHENKEDLHLRRDERHKEEEHEEEEVSDKRSEEDRSSEEASRRSTRSLCGSSRGDESLNCYGPMSPTFKKLLIQFYPDEVSSRVSADGKCTIIERTESLRKSTNNMRKTLQPAVSKIDKKLEQYTHALELASKEGRTGSQALTDLTSTTELVSSKKNLFEAGEAWSQNAASVTPSKDADGLKVGVADLINQWVRGSEAENRCSSPSKPADSSSGKRYKFVVTGHGKYEKIPEDNSCSEDANCQSDGQFYEDL
uniref:lymphocyte-specific protein 1-like isoform X2 n=1 Tax=Scatophagus argus TaxID=75038 RepID=UPI001ED84748|nr:lymphocyte-specific protein 1-like isoform X2 [Scatophagus argus]